METDEVINGVLIKATQPKTGEPYVWPEGVTKIGDYAFAGWENFNQPFSIPKSVTEIGHLVFSNWSKFNQPFSIPKSVTKIGNYAFANWHNFNQPFSIPKGVTKIGDSAFYNWYNFNQTFIIPKSVIQIKEYAFYNWNNFNQPNSRRAAVTSDWLRIDDWVFAGCYSGTLKQLRKRLDDGESTPAREKAWESISQPFSR